jgi:SOS response regulatory protein OraA/RecX
VRALTEAQLQRKLEQSVGDRRLVADLVKRGIQHDLARSLVEQSRLSEEERLIAAYAKVLRARPRCSMPTAAQTLERRGFAASTVYRFLRSEAARAFSR